MIVELTPAEYAAIQTNATFRQATNVTRGIANRKADPNRTDLEINIVGMVAEYAVAKAFNLHLELSFAPRSGGWDLIGRNGQRLDVKAVTQKTKGLNVNARKKPGTTDYFVLCYVDALTVEIVGFISEADALQPKYLTDYGFNGGAFYAVPQTDLKPIKGVSSV